MIRQLLLVTVLTTLSTIASAQPTGGMITALPAGVVFESGPQPWEILQRIEGASAPAIAFPVVSNGPSNVPNFSTTSMFGALAQDVRIDGMSTGNDLMPLTETGVMDPALFQAWAMFAIGFASNAKGQSGSYLEEQSNSPTGPGGDLFGFYFEGSGLPNHWVGKGFVEQEVDSYTNLPAGPIEITAYDAYMSMIVNNEGVPNAFVPNTTSFFFTVTSSSALSLPSTFFELGPRRAARRFCARTGIRRPRPGDRTSAPSSRVTSA